MKWYNTVMTVRSLLLLVLCTVCSTSWAFAQTLGSTLDSIRSDAQSVASRHLNAPTWGVQTAADDLNRFVAECGRLSAGLASDDARDVEALQRGFKSAARRVETSSVMLPDADQAELDQILDQVALVDQRLTELRLRFGSQANMVYGALDNVSLVTSDDPIGQYANIKELLIDVRCARSLASSLRVGRYPLYGFGFNEPNNLDSLQVRRVVQAAWALERDLSVQIDDVSQSVPAWDRFYREYNRLGYPGTGSNVRQLERVVSRLERFYSAEENRQ
jgi:hypothetical protein